MFPSIRCPHCAKLLGKVHEDGSLQAECLSCRRSYGVVYGKLSGWSSRWEALLFLSAKLPSFYKRRYELRLTTPGRELKVLKFSTPGREDRVPAQLGDRVSFLYSTRGSAIRKLIAISNHSRGSTYHLPTPISSVWDVVRAWGAAALLVYFYVVLMGSGFWMVTVLGAIATLAATRLVDAAELTTPELQPDRREDARLLAERKLMMQKRCLEERVEGLKQEGAENEALIQRLQALRTKMQNVDAALYAQRMRRVEQAIALLQQRTQHDRYLSGQYGQTVRMIEIELETAYLADQLPDAHDFSGAILGKLAELKAIEDRNRQIQLTLAANEEVRRLSP